MRRSLTIFIPTVAILSWWFVAFKNPIADEPPHISFDCNANPSLVLGDQLYSSSRLLNLDRDVLKQALEGDVQQMTALIQKWDVDAEILENHGYTNVKRLDRQTYIRSQLIGRALCESDPQELESFNEELRQKFVVDDKGSPINLEDAPSSFVPQTFLSAELLLSLAEPSQIAALPSSFRELASYVSRSKVDSVEREIDVYSNEWLYTNQPDVAFISQSYSHPTTIHTLQKLGIALYNTGEISSITDIKHVISNFGHIVNAPLKAELMNCFIDSALNAIDNKRNCLIPNIADNRVLVAFYHTRFSLPGGKTLTRKLLERIGIKDDAVIISDEDIEMSWTIPLPEEAIHHYNPEYFIIITHDNENALTYFNSLPALHQVEAVKNRKVSVLNDGVQRTLSQYIVLAYYDLNNALVNLQ